MAVAPEKESYLHRQVVLTQEGCSLEIRNTKRCSNSLIGLLPSRIKTKIGSKCILLQERQLHHNPLPKKRFRRYCKSRRFDKLAASLVIPKEENRNVVVIGRRLLATLPEVLRESKKVCNVEIPKETTRDWRMPFLKFQLMEASQTIPLKRLEVAEGVPNCCPKKCVLSSIIWWHTASPHHDYRNTWRH